MTGNCPKCKTRWTGNAMTYIVNGRRVRKFRCPNCGNSATQRLRASKKIDLVADILASKSKLELL